MFKHLIPALCLAFAPLTATAGIEGTETYIQDDFNIAGLTIGMQPDTVLQKMEALGYKLTEEDDYNTTRGPSFNELVQIVAGDIGEDSGRDSWKNLTFRKGSDEGIHVRFHPLPTGTAAYHISYYNMSSTMTKERFMTAVESKYGRPRYTANGGGEKLWSDMKLIGTSSFDVDAGALQLIAADGPPQHGSNEFQQVKGSITIRGGKISLLDPEQLAKDWTNAPETTF